MLLSYICGVFLLTFVWDAEATYVIKKVAVIGLAPICQGANEKYVYCAAPTQKTINRLNTDTNEVDTTRLPCGSPNVVLPFQNLVVVCYNHTVFIGNFTTANFKFLVAVDPFKPFNSIRRGLADGRGFLWLATLFTGTNTTNTTLITPSSLNRIKDKRTVALRPNENDPYFAFDPNYNYIYILDSKNGRIIVYDFYLPDGSIKNSRVFFVFTTLPGEIVGKLTFLVIDIKGNLYVSKGKSIVVISPSGKYLYVIILPTGVINVTSMVFGGKDLAILYVSCITGTGGVVYAVMDLETRGIKAEFTFNEDAYYLTNN